MHIQDGVLWKHVGACIAHVRMIAWSPPLLSRCPNVLMLFIREFPMLLSAISQCTWLLKKYFGENVRSAIDTAHSRGAALVACARAGVVLGEYTPMQIKQAVVGTGSADKRQVIFMVRNILNLDHDPRPDHCADALAAAICHASLLRTQQAAYQSASVEMLEQQRAEALQHKLQARALTAAASKAHSDYAHGIGNVMDKTRQSRRNK